MPFTFNPFTGKLDKIIKEIFAGTDYVGTTTVTKLTVSATEPVSPTVNDLWVDIS